MRTTGDPKPPMGTQREFALRHGVMGFGVLAGGFFSLVNRPGDTPIISWEFVGRLGVGVLVFCVAGWFWGLLMWRALNAMAASIRGK